jgi:hypothetical protein
MNGSKGARMRRPDWSGGLTLLIPLVAIYAATALGVVMAGAVFTHLRQAELGQSAMPFVLLLALVMIGYSRLPSTAS